MRPLLRRAAWAPLLVLTLHQAVLCTPWRQPLDFAMHFSGGAAIAFFLWHAIDGFARWLDALTPFARYLFAFTPACTVGLFWEFAELYSDAVHHTHIQHSVHETMRDLFANATGALTTLTGVFIVRCVRKAA